MIIYLDLLILSTILVNYLFIKTISVIYKEKLSLIRVIISLVLSVVSLLLYLLPYKIYFVIRYFIGIIIGMIVFKDNNKLNKLIKIIIFYLLNMAFIGTLVVFDIHSFIPMILSVIYIILLYIIQTYQKNIYTKQTIGIYINNVKYNAYLDTGNICCYNNRPVVFINKKHICNIYKELDEIKINTIGSDTYIKIYSGPNLIYNNIEYDVYYAFDDNLVYDVLLNNLMGGNI